MAKADQVSGVKGDQASKTRLGMNRVPGIALITHIFVVNINHEAKVRVLSDKPECPF